MSGGLGRGDSNESSKHRGRVCMPGTVYRDGIFPVLAQTDGVGACYAHFRGQTEEQRAKQVLWFRVTW